MEGSVSPRTNKLLALLSEAEYRRIRPHLHFVEYEPGQRLVQEGAKTRYVQFPVSGIIARMVYDRDGESNEFGICGNEGAIGLSGLSGSGADTPLGTSLVIVKTAVYRCAPSVIEKLMDSPELRAIVIRYFRYVLCEAMLVAFCNKHHSLHQQMCRLLLMLTDRAFSTEVRTTHQMMGHLLGSRREGVTEAAGRLGKQNALVRTRGMLRVTDRDAVLQQTCDCYFRLQSRYSALVLPEEPLPGTASAEQ